MINQSGIFTISLDFELQYGLEDHTKSYLDKYSENLKGVKNIIPQILNLFEESQIHATWAIVGLLLLSNKEDFKNYCPKNLPKYSNMNLSVYEHFDRVKENPSLDEFHYGFLLAKAIRDTQNQELATHTFSHLYCNNLIGENKREVFCSDLLLAKQIMQEKLGVTPTSVVFPRNQINDDFIQLLPTLGYSAYRGCPTPTVYNTTSRAYSVRIKRLLDSYLSIYGFKNQRKNDVLKRNVCNTQASAFLRPYSSKLRIFEKLKIHQIKRGMKDAALNNRIYHLWWHPHNFGIFQKENMNNLKEIILYYQYLKKNYGMKSKTMKEISEMILGGKR